MKQNEIDRELRKKQALERDLKTTKMELEAKRVEAEEKQTRALTLHDEVCQNACISGGRR